MFDIKKLIDKWESQSDEERAININKLIDDILLDKNEEFSKETEQKLKRIDIINEIAIDEIKKDKKQNNILKFEQNKKIKKKIKKIIKKI